MIPRHRIPTRPSATKTRFVPVVFFVVFSFVLRFSSRALRSPRASRAPVRVFQVMDAPEAKVDAARDRFCPPYKPAQWPPFLAEVLGRGAAAEHLRQERRPLRGLVRGAEPVARGVHLGLGRVHHLEHADGGARRAR